MTGSQVTQKPTYVKTTSDKEVWTSMAKMWCDTASARKIVKTGQCYAC